MPANIVEPLQSLAVPIDTLRLLDGNPRRGDVDAVARSYERFGQRKPIVALHDGTVIAGNHQLLAAQKLGWDEIAVTFVDDDEMTAKAFALADNRTSDLGSYDSEALAELLANVAVDPDLLLATGYDEADLEALIHLTTPPDLDDLVDDIGEPTEEDGLVRVALKLPQDLAEALSSELARFGSHAQAVSLWLNL